jgi:hypothetical protein
VLCAIGVATVRTAPAWRDRPFSLVPLLFGIQQLAEGVLWAALGGGDAALATGAARVYTTFSHVMWPVLIPLAVMLQEPQRTRQRMVAGLLGGGVAVAALYAFSLWTNGVHASAAGNSLVYAVSVPFPWLQGLAYIAVTCGSLLLSSRRSIVVFGVAALLSAGIAYALYRQAFASVWCFFAAGLSLLVYAHFRARRAPRPDRT